jgi:ATPase subunit of ABC transporter with duplicated ATPase domains
MMGGKQVNSRAYLSRFNFGGEQNKKVSMLSGGERNRLHLNDLKRRRKRIAS